jgi:hypothetical protein
VITWDWNICHDWHWNSEGVVDVASNTIYPCLVFRIRLRRLRHFIGASPSPASPAGALPSLERHHLPVGVRRPLEAVAARS